MTLELPLRPRKTLKPALRRRNIAHREHENVVPTSLFQPELERIIKKLQLGIRDGSNGDKENGAVKMLADGLAAQNGDGAEKYLRRLYDWRTGRTRAIKATVVDRIYQTVDETYTHPTVPIAEFPAGPDAAKEMVDTWCADWSEEDREALATKLLHFGQGFCLGWDVIDLEIINGLELFFRHQYR